MRASYGMACDSGESRGNRSLGGRTRHRGRAQRQPSSMGMASLGSPTAVKRHRMLHLTYSAAVHLLIAIDPEAGVFVAGIRLGDRDAEPERIVWRQAVPSGERVGIVELEEESVARFLEVDAP